jgi:DNA-binding NtrC family response regulator
LALIRQRPGGDEAAQPVLNPFLSREHLRIERRDDETLHVRCAGRRRMRAGERECQELSLRRGDSFQLDHLYAFLCVERPPQLEPAEVGHVFGQPDADGIVGESPAAWDLRRRVAFVARRGAHVLVSGPSGSGKELVARAIHRASARGSKELVARNAATLPSGLIDAELFGNCRNYPNPGMAERSGLIGQAHGSSLFLDEIGEIGAELQARLLRVLDAGEYHRLGEATVRRADLRFIAATNRAPAELKHDLAARLALHIELGGLDERLEDIPLLARQIVSKIARQDPEIGRRFLRNWDGESGEPRLSPQLACALVGHVYSTHVRELEALLWRSIESSSGHVLELAQPVLQLVRPRPPARPSEEISRAELLQALARNGGVKELVWQELKLRNRYQLARLLRKHGVS